MTQRITNCLLLLASVLTWRNYIISYNEKFREYLTYVPPSSLLDYLLDSDSLPERATFSDVLGLCLQYLERVIAIGLAFYCLLFCYRLSIKISNSLTIGWPVNASNKRMLAPLLTHRINISYQRRQLRVAHLLIAGCQLIYCLTVLHTDGGIFCGIPPHHPMFIYHCYQGSEYFFLNTFPFQLLVLNELFLYSNRRDNNSHIHTD
ncbi:hypothetical protein SAMD00019534_048550 [Acytostelium subglobosum LB1]|uniref:hypothetical protein n=1 Tax=Acytostelium subglobosum LB1 TaxID=1410327 RepID=UPI000644D172|nr:hypothetical protein SAMD00019534_048550 [Acytostelium subglobosum LB1]GAM21680.1 hypothetical protein SAMD00019534_048550 [Acytostelium subglobosum LB1]|eukprot:XP_012755799.1 hypothetical protein SAMD00019534_048550 [Acytostelium subglobosum LB1]